MNSWTKMTIYTILIILTAISFLTSVFAETLVLDSRKGIDTNPGTALMPIKTFKEAAKRINNSIESGPTVIKVAPGIHILDETVLFYNDRAYTEHDRLIIEAEILPDDPRWKPELMPIILSIGLPQEWRKSDEPIDYTGFKIEINHVTIRGLKFLGNPIPEIWYYPIFREGKDLNDLVVTQCLFTMDSYAVTSNVCILANGHGLVVDHCIFYNCRNPVVFWRAESGTSHGNTMRHCIVDGAYTSAVWVCDTGEDFEFHHNIITHSRYAWIRDEDNKRTYRLHDCIITENEYNSGQCGANWKLDPTGPDITFEEENVTKSGKVIMETIDGIDADIPTRYLHVVPDSLGSGLDAGLFKKITKENHP